MNRWNGNCAAFLTVLLRTVTSVWEGGSHQLAHPNNAKHATMNAPFQLIYGDLMGPLKPTARGVYEFISKIIDQFTK